MDLSPLARAVADTDGCSGCTMFHRPETGWMVSLRIGDAMRVFYGDDLTETTLRAFAGGPQHPVSDWNEPEEDWGAELV